MVSVRLDKDTERKLDAASKIENLSKTDIIKKALSEYFLNHPGNLNPYDLGRNLFGQHGSGQSDNSVNYKQKLKEKLNEKHSH